MFLCIPRENWRFPAREARASASEVATETAVEGGTGRGGRGAGKRVEGRGGSKKGRENEEEGAEGASPPLPLTREDLGEPMS